MDPKTLLHRQVHPSFVQAGRVSSQVFRPTPKDKNLLSMYDGHLIGPEKAWNHYTGVLGLVSVGSFSLSEEECGQVEVPVLEDRSPFPEHVSLDFSFFSKSKTELIAKKLRDFAVRRSRTYGRIDDSR